MGDKGTGGDMTDEFENVGDKVLSAILARAAGVVEFTEDQADDLKELAGDIGDAIKGDEHAASAVKAILLLKKFTGEARAYLEFAAAREAIADGIADVLDTIKSTAPKIAGELIVGLLKGAIEDAG